MSRGSARAAAVLFDMDGLLVDSEPLWTVAEEELAAHLGGRWSPDLKAAVVGTRLDVAVPAILEWYAVEATPARVEEASSFLLRRMVELFDSELPLMPGALGLLEGLGAVEVPLALVSSSYRVLVDAALRQLDSGGRPGDGPLDSRRHDSRFAVTIAGDEIAHGKPHPEPYLTACARLRVDPLDCVVLEDAPSGIASAEAAGCVAVAVPSVAPIVSDSGRPVVASLTEIDPDWLLGLPARLRAATR